MWWLGWLGLVEMLGELRSSAVGVSNDIFFRCFLIVVVTTVRSSVCVSDYRSLSFGLMSMFWLDSLVHHTLTQLRRKVLVSHHGCQLALQLYAT